MLDLSRSDRLTLTLAGLATVLGLAASANVPDLPPEPVAVVAPVEAPEPEVTTPPVIEGEVGEYDSTGAPDFILDAVDAEAGSDLSLAYEYVSQTHGFWRPVDSGLADALASGGSDIEDQEAAANYTERDWSICYVADGDTSVVACPDGFVETS